MALLSGSCRGLTTTVMKVHPWLLHRVCSRYVSGFVRAINGQKKVANDDIPRIFGERPTTKHSIYSTKKWKKIEERRNKKGIILGEGCKMFVHKTKPLVIVHRAATGHNGIFQMHITDPNTNKIKKVIHKVCHEPTLRMRTLDLDGLGFRMEIHLLNLEDKPMRYLFIKAGNTVFQPAGKWHGRVANRIPIPECIRVEIYNKRRIRLFSFDHMKMGHFIAILKRWFPFNKYLDHKKGLYDRDRAQLRPRIVK